jgi:hypothetical protein
MVSITQDPLRPEKLALTITATLYLDRLLVETLNQEIEKAIREQAIRDLQENKEVKLAVFKAAQRKLLALLGVPNAAAKEEHGKEDQR